MNKAKMVELLEDGAYVRFDGFDGKFCHPSFSRKGYRSISHGNISWVAVQNAHGVRGTNRLQRDADGVYRLIAA